MLCISLYLRGNQEAVQLGLIIRIISPCTSYPASQLLTLSGVPGQLQLLRARRGGGAVCRGGGDVDEDLAAALVRDLDTGQAWTRGHSLFILYCLDISTSPPSPVSTLLRPSSGSAAAAGGSSELGRKMF